VDSDWGNGSGIGGGWSMEEEERGDGKKCEARRGGGKYAIDVELHTNRRLFAITKSLRAMSHTDAGSGRLGGETFVVCRRRDETFDQRFGKNTQSAAKYINCL